MAAKLKSGSNFADLAKTYSSGPTAAQGGDLGVFKRGQLAKLLEDKTFALQAGQVTDPIRTKQGFVILKVDEHTPGGVVALKDVEPQVEDAVAQEKMEPAVRKYLKQAREEAYIEYKPGYVDTAAVTNPGKPVYSAYTPPSPKKKRKLVRTRYHQRTPRTKAAPATTQTAAAPPERAIARGCTPGQRGKYSRGDGRHTERDFERADAKLRAGRSCWKHIGYRCWLDRGILEQEDPALGQCACTKHDEGGQEGKDSFRTGAARDAAEERKHAQRRCGFD